MRWRTIDPLERAHDIAKREASKGLTTADYVWGNGFDEEFRRYQAIFQQAYAELSDQHLAENTH
jgi:hypothetical protein